MSEQEKLEKALRNIIINSLPGTYGVQSERRNPCEHCSNNPKNGGSGICGCTLPRFYGNDRITC